MSLSWGGKVQFVDLTACFHMSVLKKLRHHRRELRHEGDEGGETANDGGEDSDYPGGSVYILIVCFFV